MIIEKMFNYSLALFEPFLGEIYLSMGIIAVICVIMGIFKMFQKEKYGKYLSLVGCLLMINPIIYLIFR